MFKHTKGNVQVVYAILRYKKAFARLANMTLVPPGDDESEVEASLGGPVQQQRGSDKDGFVGTQAWFDEWKTKMPLGTVLRVIDRTFFLFFFFCSFCIMLFYCLYIFRFVTDSERFVDWYSRR